MLPMRHYSSPLTNRHSLQGKVSYSRAAFINDWNRSLSFHGGHKVRTNMKDNESPVHMSPCLQMFIESLLQGADHPSRANMCSSFATALGGSKKRGTRARAASEAGR